MAIAHSMTEFRENVRLALNGILASKSAFPLNVYAFDCLPSTMEKARNLLELAAEQNTCSENGEQDSLCTRVVGTAEVSPVSISLSAPICIVLAREQTAGRGRLGRSWFSEKDAGIYLTFALRLNSVSPSFAGLSLVVGLAVNRVCEQLGVKSQIKWPNDVLTPRPWLRKLSGILVDVNSQGEHGSVLSIGIGLNVSQKEFPAEIPGTSLAQELGVEVDYFTVVALLISEVTNTLNRFFQLGFSAFQTEIERHSLNLGQYVSVKVNGEAVAGRFLGIASDGALRLQVSKSPEGTNDEIVIYSGELCLSDANGG